jgi:hypothetical protein
MGFTWQNQKYSIKEGGKRVSETAIVSIALSIFSRSINIQVSARKKKSTRNPMYPDKP